MKGKTIQHLLDKCTGCGYCQTKCPQNAIRFQENEKGFLSPFIDDIRCVGCGICYEECILNNVYHEAKTIRDVYASYSLDAKVRLSSASGGIFTEMATEFLHMNQKGVVIGATYQDAYRVRHIAISDECEIERLRQSKYVQSDMGEIYQIINSLDDDVPILFAGTPCQVAAFSNYMHRRNNAVIYVDFICRGVNSPGVYHKYLEELAIEKGSNVARVWFKNKETGWNHYQTRIDFENGEIYTNNRWEDPFMRGFLKHNLYMRESCFNCQFRGIERQADITLADFWGIHFEDSSVDVEDGVSAVLIHSETGEEIFNRIREKIYCEKKTVEDVQKGNICMEKSPVKGEYTEEFFERLKKEPFSKIIWSIEERLR